MKLSFLQFVKHKFYQERDYVFEDRKFVGRFLRSNYFAGLGLMVGLMFFIHEFAMPTPDIQYDVRQIVSPDFNEFIKSKGLNCFNPAHRHYVENFNYTVEGLKRKQNQEYFGRFETKEQ